MNIFWSCHLIINRPPSDDGRHVCDIIDADYFGGEALLLHFLNLLPLQTLTFLIAIRVHVGKTLTKSPAKNAN